VPAYIAIGPGPQRLPDPGIAVAFVEKCELSKLSPVCIPTTCELMRSVLPSRRRFHLVSPVTNGTIFCLRATYWRSPVCHPASVSSGLGMASG
jgi:hypothetical protein